VTLVDMIFSGESKSGLLAYADEFFKNQSPFNLTRKQIARQKKSLLKSKKRFVLAMKYPDKYLKLEKARLERAYSKPPRGNK